MSPQAWMSLTPAVWDLSSAWISPAIGRRVSACCSIQARRMRDRKKLMAEPSRSMASTLVGSCACSLGSAVRKCESGPGRTLWTARRLLRQLMTVARSTLYCSLFRNVWFSRCRPSLDESSSNLIIASARLTVCSRFCRSEAKFLGQ